MNRLSRSSQALVPFQNCEELRLQFLTKVLPSKSTQYLEFAHDLNPKVNNLPWDIYVAEIALRGISLVRTQLFWPFLTALSPINMAYVLNQYGFFRMV